MVESLLDNIRFALKDLTLLHKEKLIKVRG